LLLTRNIRSKDLPAKQIHVWLFKTDLKTEKFFSGFRIDLALDKFKIAVTDPLPIARVHQEGIETIKCFNLTTASGDLCKVVKRKKAAPEGAFLFLVVSLIAFFEQSPMVGIHIQRFAKYFKSLIKTHGVLPIIHGRLTERDTRHCKGKDEKESPAQYHFIQNKIKLTRNNYPLFVGSNPASGREKSIMIFNKGVPMGGAEMRAKASRKLPVPLVDEKPLKRPKIQMFMPVSMSGETLMQPRESKV
jgi:hypothetical protein